MIDFSKMEPNDEVLDVIENHLSELDTSGLYMFIINVIHDKGLRNATFGNIAYTLSLFLMNMFEDDQHALMNHLVDSGYKKWSGLDTYNHENQLMLYGHLTLESYVKHQLEYKLPSSKIFGEGIPLDFSYLSTLGDYIISDNEVDSTVTKPFIGCEVYLKNIDKSMWDKLYIGLKTDSDKYCISNRHYALPPSRTIQICEGEGENVCYTTIENAIYLREHEYKNSRPIYMLSTALPLEIVEKYNLPIYKG